MKQIIIFFMLLFIMAFSADAQFVRFNAPASGEKQLMSGYASWKMFTFNVVDSVGGLPRKGDAQDSIIGINGLFRANDGNGSTYRTGAALYDSGFVNNGFTMGFTISQLSSAAVADPSNVNNLQNISIILSTTDNINNSDGWMITLSTSASSSVTAIKQYIHTGTTPSTVSENDFNCWNSSTNTPFQVGDKFMIHINSGANDTIRIYKNGVTWWQSGAADSLVDSRHFGTTVYPMIAMAMYTPTAFGINNIFIGDSTFGNSTPPPTGVLAPTITATVSPNSAAFNVSGGFNFITTCTSVDKLAVSPSVALTLRLDGAVIRSKTESTAVYSDSIFYNDVFARSAVGYHTLQLTAIDSAANTDSTSFQFYVADTTSTQGSSNTQLAYWWTSQGMGGGYLAYPPSALPWNRMTTLSWFCLYASTTPPYIFSSSDSMEFETSYRSTGNTNTKVQVEILDSAAVHGTTLLICVSDQGTSTLLPLIRDTTVGGAGDTFTANLLGVVQRHHYNGVDFDMEALTNSASDRACMTVWLRRMRAILNTWSPRGTLNITLPYWANWSAGNPSAGLVLDTVDHNYIDHVNPMGYNEEYPSIAGHSSPLHGNWTGAGVNTVYPTTPSQGTYWEDPHGYTEYINNEHFSLSQINMGLSAEGKHGTASGTATLGGALTGDMRSQYLSYYSNIPAAALANPLWDAVDSASYYVSGSNFYGFETPQSLTARVAWINARKIGGIIVYDPARWNAVANATTPGTLDAALATALGGTVVNNIPSVPTLLSPSNNLQNVAINGVVLKCSNVPYAQSFQYRYSTDQTFNTNVQSGNLTGSADTIFTLPKLSNGTTYYWSFQAVSSTGYTSGWATANSFMTVALPKATLTPPAILYPASNSTGQTIPVRIDWSFVWADTNHTQEAGYNAEWGTDSTFSVYNLVSSLSDTGYNLVNLVSGTKYFWRVQSSRSDTTSGWSSVANFTTAATQAQTSSSNLSGSLTWNGQHWVRGQAWVTLPPINKSQIQASPDSTVYNYALDGSGKKDYLGNWTPNIDVTQFANSSLSNVTNPKFSTIGLFNPSNPSNVVNLGVVPSNSSTTSNAYVQQTATTDTVPTLGGVRSTAGSGGGGTTYSALQMRDSVFSQKYAAQDTINDSTKIHLNHAGSDIQTIQVGNGYVLYNVPGSGYKIQFQNSNTGDYTEWNGAKYDIYANQYLQGLGISTIPDTIARVYGASGSAVNFDSSRVNGLYKIVYYLVVSTTGSAGTAKVQFTWNDGVQADSVSSSNVTLTSLGSYVSGTIPIYNGNATKPWWTVLFSGATGSPIVKLYAVIERMF